MKGRERKKERKKKKKKLREKELPSDDLTLAYLCVGAPVFLLCLRISLQYRDTVYLNVCVCVTRERVGRNKQSHSNSSQIHNWKNEHGSSLIAFAFSVR